MVYYGKYKGRGFARGVAKGLGVLGASYAFGAGVKAGAFPTTVHIDPNWQQNVTNLLNPMGSTSGALTFSGLVGSVLLTGASELGEPSTAKLIAKLVGYGIEGAIGLSLAQGTVDPPPSQPALEYANWNPNRPPPVTFQQVPAVPGPYEVKDVFTQTPRFSNLF